MIRRIALFALLFLLAFSTRGEALHGAWTASRSETAGTIHLNLTYEGRNQFGRSFALEALRGLTDAQLDAVSSAPVAFEIRREAGTVSFHGSFERGDGAGQFEFAPNRGFFRSVESLGVSVAGEKQNDEHLLSYALLDLSTTYIREMRGEGYDVDLEKYLAMRIFGVTREVIAEYRRLGFDHIPYEKLIAMRVHRVTPEFIEKMRAAGYSSLSPGDLITFRIHRVTPEVISELRDLGYDKIPAKQLVAMSIHRVTPEYIRGLEKAGYSNIPVEKLLDLRIRGIDDSLVRKMR